MHPVKEQGGKDGIDHRIECGVHGEEEGADGVEDDIEGQGELSHREIGALFAQIQTQHVQTAGAAAAGENDTVRKTGTDAADETGGERVGNNGHGRGRDQRQSQGVDGDTESHAQHEAVSKGAPCQQQKGNVDKQIQSARQIEGKGEMKILHQQGADDLTDTVESPCVESLRYNEEIDGSGSNNGTEQSQNQSQ